jgi:hypothetical protein
MSPIDFNQSNRRFGPPEGVSEEQCGTLFAHVGEVRSGPNEGVPIVVTCWIPTPEEREKISEGSPIFMTMVGGGLMPHVLTTEFPTTL